MRGVIDRSISGGLGAGGALAIAAAMTASISAEVGGREGEYGRVGLSGLSCVWRSGGRDICWSER